MTWRRYKGHGKYALAVYREYYAVLDTGLESKVGNRPVNCELMLAGLYSSCNSYARGNVL